MIRFPAIHLIEVIFGGLLLITGISYLSVQSRAIDHMSELVLKSMLIDKAIYQQANVSNINVITDEQLIAVVMGYREYPISIDGTTLTIEQNDFDTYLPFIQDGYYSKSYEFDINNDIKKVIFTFIGIT